MAHDSEAPHYLDRITGIPPHPTTRRRLGRTVTDRLVSPLVEFADVPAELQTLSGKRPRLEAVHQREYAPPLAHRTILNTASPAEVDAGLRYVSRIFPKLSIQLLSTEGSSAFVFEDSDQRYVFKMGRLYGQAEHSYVEREVKLMQQLHRLQLAPKPYLLVDPKKESQFAGRDFTTPTDEKIPRVREDGNLAIIVMDKVNFTDISNMPPDKLVAEFDRALAASEELDIVFSDTEFEYDSDHDRLVAIDVGAVSHNPLELKYSPQGEDRYPELTDAEYKKAAQISGLFNELIKKPTSIMRLPETIQLLHSGGLPAIHQRLVASVYGEPESLV